MWCLETIIKLNQEAAQAKAPPSQAKAGSVADLAIMPVGSELADTKDWTPDEIFRQAS